MLSKLIAFLFYSDAIQSQYDSENPKQAITTIFIGKNKTPLKPGAVETIITDTQFGRNLNERSRLILDLSGTQTLFWKKRDSYIHKGAFLEGLKNRYTGIRKQIPYTFGDGTVFSPLMEEWHDRMCLSSLCLDYQPFWVLDEVQEVSLPADGVLGLGNAPSTFTAMMNTSSVGNQVFSLSYDPQG